MGFFLLLLYLGVSYLSPDQIDPELGQYRIVLWIAIAAILASLPVIPRTGWLFRLPHSYLLFGLLMTMMLSHLAHLWFGGVFYTLNNFMPVLVIFFLICLHVNTWNRLRTLVIVFFAIALFLLCRALWDFHLGDLNSPYLMVMNWTTTASRFSFVRIRAVGYLNDPNDFGQFLLVVLPLMTIFWVAGKKLRNSLSVILPCALLIYGIYLTRSRGALLGLTVLLILFMSRRVPASVSVITGLVLFGALKVFGFTGGRDVSIESGSDRIDLWGSGLHMFRTSPLWGVGFGKFADFAPLTAHNSFVLCLAEVGLLGYSCWLATLVVTFLQLNSLAVTNSKQSIADQNKVVPAESPVDQQWSSDETWSGPQMPPEPIQADLPRPTQTTKHDELIRKWASAIRLSLIAFVVTGWFLSRTYTMTLYVVLGMAVVLTRLAKNSPAESAKQYRNWVPITLAAEVATIVVLYVIIRIEGVIVH
jgi:O-antigen ligase